MIHDDLHALLSDAVGPEPPIGSPHAAVRRRAGQLRRRRQAAGAAAGAAGIAAAAIALPVLRDRAPGAEAPAAQSKPTLPVSTTPAMPSVDPSGFELNFWPADPMAQSPETPACTVTVVSSARGAAGPGLQADGFGPGLDARAAGQEPAGRSRAESLDMGVLLTPDQNVTSIDRIVVGLDQQPQGNHVYCDLRDVDFSAVATGQALRVSYHAAKGPAQLGTYKGVALVGYTTADGTRREADAELGSYQYR
ncbi:MAG: hypothetical protein ABI912_04275 [Actinomycetota bacterium]